MSMTNGHVSGRLCASHLDTDKPQADEEFNIIDWMSHPLTVAEGVPPWLATIVSPFKDSSTMINDSLVAVFYVIMHECGFTVKEDEINESFSFDVRILKHLPDRNIRSIWKNGSDHYQFNFVLSSLTNIVKLLIIPFDGFLIVELYTGDQVLPLAFRTDDYVFVNEGQVVFHNLRKLSCAFKNLCCVVRDNILYENRLPVTTNLQTFPYELLLKICSLFRPNTFSIFSMTCKQFYETVYADEIIWKKFAKKYLNIDYLSEPHLTWQNLFIHKQTVRQQLARLVRLSYDTYEWYPYDSAPAGFRFEGMC